MKPKIFNTLAYIIILFIGFNPMVYCQGLSPQQEKKMEQKMQQLEQKMSSLQQKIEHLKIDEKSMAKLDTPPLDFKDFDKILNEAVKNIDKGAIAFNNMGENFARSFKNIGPGFNPNVQDGSIDEKIKNGEIKELTKTYSKSYNISKDDKLVIDNKFGKVTINTWAKNEFKVDVEIKAGATEDGDAQKMLNGVTIDDNKNGSTVSFKTNINNAVNNSWEPWMHGGKSYVHKIEINYVVYMPAKNALNITNRYGATILPDFDGKLMLNCSYGSITAKTLTNPSNDITSRYGSANIESLNGSALNVAYGSLNLGSGDNLNADISYGSAKIGKIKTSGSINIRYTGGFQISEVDKNLKSLSINASYSPVALGITDGVNLNFDVVVSYGSFNYNDRNLTTITNKSPADTERGFNPTKTYKGYIGKGNPERTISINSKYGNVKFN